MKCQKPISQTDDILVNLTKENIAYNRSFLRNVFYEKSRFLLKTKRKYFVKARIYQSFFCYKIELTAHVNILLQEIVYWAL